RLRTIEHLPRMWHEQDSLLFSPFPHFGVDLPIVNIAQVHPMAAFFGDAGCQRDLDARRLGATGAVVGACPFDVRAVCQDGAWHIFETLPLLEEIVPHVVAHLVDQLAVRVGYLADM